MKNATIVTSHQRTIANGNVYISSEELAAISDELIAVLEGYESQQMISFLVHKIVEDTTLYALLLQKNPACHYDLKPLSKYHLSCRLAIINDTLAAYVRQNKSSFAVENPSSRRTGRQSTGNFSASKIGSSPNSSSVTNQHRVFKVNNNQLNQNNHDTRFSSRFERRLGGK